MKKSIAWVAAGLFLGVVLFSAQGPQRLRLRMGNKCSMKNALPAMARWRRQRPHGRGL